MKIHPIRTGQLVGNRTFLRSESWSAVFRRRADVEFPVFSFVIERPEGLVAIDSGLGDGIRVPRSQRRFAPTPLSVGGELGARMRDAGFDPAEVRTVVLTHLDWDHTGGLAEFTNAEIHVHRPELEFAQTLPGRLRYQPKHWPSEFKPAVYDLEPEHCGPFPHSKPLSDDGELMIVPLAGHSIGQVGVLARGERADVLFCADHCLRQDWFAEDMATGREVSLGIFFRDDAVETSRRIERLARERPLLLAPSHDADMPERLARHSCFSPV